MEGSKLKSLIRHIITGLGSILVFIGVSQFTDLSQWIIENFDVMWDTGATMVGFVLTIIGFVKDGSRHKARDSIPDSES